MDSRIQLTETQVGMLMALLEKRARLNRQIDAQVVELAEMFCAKAGVGDDWRLTGNPQTGFALVPPEEEGDDKPADES